MIKIHNKKLEYFIAKKIFNVIMCRHLCIFFNKHASARPGTHRAGMFSVRPCATTLKSLFQYITHICLRREA